MKNLTPWSNSGEAASALTVVETIGGLRELSVGPGLNARHHRAPQNESNFSH